MEPLMAAAETIAIVVAGILLRFLIVAVGLAVIALPLAAVFMAWRAFNRATGRAEGLERAGGPRWQHGLTYMPGHTWLKAEGERWRVGIDDLLQRLVPDARHLRLVPVGSRVRQGDLIAEIEANGHTAHVRAPISGTVAEVNVHAAQDPHLLNDQPYRNGWLALIVPSERALPATARRGRDAREWLRHEDFRLSAFLEQRLGIAAADGGEFLLPPHTMLSPEHWAEIEREFLE